MDKILVVDDDRDILEIISDYLTVRGYEVVTATTGREALRLADAAAPDCVVLDIKLPDVSGYDICADMKKKCGAPIIFLSCLDEEGNRISGFMMGGDDYVIKPFSVAELEWRIRARLRERGVEWGERVAAGRVSVDVSSMTAYVDDVPLDLTAKELNILLLFIKSPGRVFTQEEIFKSVWNQSGNGDVRTVQVHVGRLRSKLSVVLGYPAIKTVWGRGYMLDRRSDDRGQS